VLLSTLQKYSRSTRVIVLVDKPEQQYVGKLQALFKLDAVLVYPVREEQMEQCLQASGA
jgi:hypothetical protein